jgi:hypothetical protein
MQLFGINLDTNTLLMLGIVAVVLALLFTNAAETAAQAVGLDSNTGNGSENAVQAVMAQDGGMYMIENENRFGTTDKVRFENTTVRPEHNKDPYPLGYGCADGCRMGGAGMKGVPDPTPGHTMVCSAGPPDKRTIDSLSSNYSLVHACRPAVGDQVEPDQLARWFKRAGCGSPDEVGINLRPICSDC